MSTVDSLFETRDVVELTGPHGERELAEPQQARVEGLEACAAAGRGPGGPSAARFRLTPYPTAQFVDALA